MFDVYICIFNMYTYTRPVQYVYIYIYISTCTTVLCRCCSIQAAVVLPAAPVVPWLYKQCCQAVQQCQLICLKAAGAEFRSAIPLLPHNAIVWSPPAAAECQRDIREGWHANLQVRYQAWRENGRNTSRARHTVYMNGWCFYCAGTGRANTASSQRPSLPELS